MTAQPTAEPDGRALGALRSYLRFVGPSLLVAIGLIGLGYLPAMRWSGKAGVAAMLAGCGVSFVASCIGAIPAARAGGNRSQVVTAILVSTGVRFVSVLALVVPLTFSGWLDRTPFVVWVGISYMLLLVTDTRAALRVLNGGSTNG